MFARAHQRICLPGRYALLLSLCLFLGACGQAAIPAPTPTLAPLLELAGVTLYISSSNSTLYAVQADTGKLHWQAQTDGLLRAAPVLQNGVIYAGSGSSVMALRASDGRVLWQTTTEGSIYSSPAVVNGVVYTGTFDTAPSLPNPSGTVYAIRASDGTILWKFRAGSPVFATPVVDHGTVFITASLVFPKMAIPILVLISLALDAAAMVFCFSSEGVSLLDCGHWQLLLHTTRHDQPPSLELNRIPTIAWPGGYWPR